jgi:Nuclease-related domain
MSMSPERWNTITESPYPWEREALEFIRQRLPDHEPYRAWANFEFIADDGSINEVDLLVLTPKGFFLVEIKSWPGEIRGDASTWIWTSPEGRVSTRDNPLLLTNRKAKKLAGLLRRQKSAKKTGVPFLDGRVFLSAENLTCALPSQLLSRVHLRDRDPGPGEAARPGIIAALTRWTAGAADDPGNRRVDLPTAKAVARALQEMGIRPSQKARRCRRLPSQGVAA